MPRIVFTDARTGGVTERDMTPEEEAMYLQSDAEKEAEVQRIADELTQNEGRMMAFALATVDLRMADITGMTQAEVRQSFRDRVVFYLRQRRGL